MDLADRSCVAPEPITPDRARLVKREPQRDIQPMTNVLYFYAVPIAAGAVALVLVLGLVNMMRGGSPNTSQRLMRLRVLLQFVAIVIVMITIWAMGR
jgi:hypothetical protein